MQYLNSLKNFRHGGMNGDDAPEVIDLSDYFVGYNIRNSGTAAGEDGYTTNIESTLLIPGARSGGINRCIGSQGFEQLRIGIAFIYNSANFHQIIEVNFDTGIQRVVFTNLTDSGGVNVLPLDPQHYVNDIKLIAETFLAFNDGFNPPFYINYIRLKAGGYGVLTANDFSLIQRQPSTTITAAYGNDASRSVNLLATKLFQFRSQFIGLDYEYSAHSTISERNVPTTEPTPSVGTDVTQNNNLILQIDAGDSRTYELVVEAQYNDLGNWFVIKTILRSDLLLLPAAIDLTQQIYEAYNPSTNIYTLVFYNDGLYQNVSVLETDQLCDAVPLVAGAMEVLNGNEIILGDISIGYARPNIAATIAAINYNPNLTVPASGGNPLTRTIKNWGSSGSGLGDHKRLVTIEFGGLVREHDIVTIVLVDIRNASVTQIYTLTCSHTDDGNTQAFVFDNAPQIPYSSSYIPTDGNAAGINIITSPYFTLQSANVTLYNAGSGQYKSIHGLKSNSSYQAALAYYDYYGRPFPLQTGTNFVVKTNSYGQSHGQTPQLNWTLPSVAPEGAYTYQWLLSQNNTHQNTLYVIASLIAFQGNWDAATNTPTLAGGTGVIGHAYQITAPSTTQNLGNGIQSYNTGDFIVYNGASWDIIPKSMGDLSISTSYYFYLNSLGQFNKKNSSSILAYDYSVNDRCTLHYYQTPGLTNAPIWFDGVTNPIADVQVQGFNAGSQFLKVNSSTAIDPSLLAGMDVLIEIYTPKKRQSVDATGATILSETAFYEIGASYPIVNGQHTVTSGAIIQGDVYFKTREMGGSIDPNVLYTPVVEDFNFSDFYISNYTSYGRPRSYSDTLETTEQVANLVYSNTYILGSKINGLTRFYAANIYGEGGGQTSSNYGRIRKLIQINNELVCIQELNHGSIPVYETILQDQIQQQNVAISEKILGNIRYTQGKHIGIGNATESVAVYNNVIYWIDPHRSEPIRWAGDGALPISGKMSKYFKTTLQSAYALKLKIIGWYDVFNDEYVISIQQTGGVVTNFTFNSTNWQYQAQYSVLPAGITISTNPSHSTASYDSSTGIVTLTPNANYVGSDTLAFQFTVDGNVITKNACFNWTAGSTTVNAFSFTPLSHQALSTEFQSNFISVTGNNIAVPISITGGQYSVNGGAFTSASGMVNPYDTVQVEVLSSATPNTSTSCTLTVGSTSGAFTVTTKQQVAIAYNLTEQANPFSDGNLQIKANGVVLITVNTTTSGTVYALEGDTVSGGAFGELPSTGTTPLLHMNVKQDPSTVLYDNTIPNNPPPTTGMLYTFTAVLGNTYTVEVDSTASGTAGYAIVNNSGYVVTYNIYNGTGGLTSTGTLAIGASLNIQSLITGGANSEIRFVAPDTGTYNFTDTPGGGTSSAGVIAAGSVFLDDTVSTIAAAVAAGNSGRIVTFTS